MEDYKKKYEEALDNFKKIKAANKDNKELVDFIEYKYPELKESEDEKIRKALKEYFINSFQNNGVAAICGVHIKDILAWLEKQGEQKAADNLRWNELTWEDVNTIEEIINEVHSDFRNGIGAESFGEEVLERFREIKGNESMYTCEQNPIDKVEPKFKVGDVIRLKGGAAEYTIRSVTNTTYYTDAWSYDIKKCEEYYELVEQKPTWSEEDEHCIELLLPIIDSSSLIPKNRKKCKKFLKSLKERVQPQPNQEWSEEEKARIDKIIDVLDWAEEKGRISYSDWEDYVCYVKSLKPQSTWKPSNEQMEALEYYMNVLNCNEHKEVLFGLYEQLKSL